MGAADTFQLDVETQICKIRNQVCITKPYFSNMKIEKQMLDSNTQYGKQSPEARCEAKVVISHLKWNVALNEV